MQTAPRFLFRDVHPQVSFGTASDPYPGWLGQIYTPARYEGRITRRTHAIGGRRYVEEVLPVDCVEKYFEHSVPSSSTTPSTGRSWTSTSTPPRPSTSCARTPDTSRRGTGSSSRRRRG